MNMDHMIFTLTIILITFVNLTEFGAKIGFFHGELKVSGHVTIAESLILNIPIPNLAPNSLPLSYTASDDEATYVVVRDRPEYQTPGQGEVAEGSLYVLWDSSLSFNKTDRKQEVIIRVIRVISATRAIRAIRAIRGLLVLTNHIALITLITLVITLTRVCNGYN